MSASGTKRALLATGLALAVSGSALGQDYTLTAVSDKYVERNGRGVVHEIEEAEFYQIELPFEFVYYGRAWDEATLDGAGFIQFLEVPPTDRAPTTRAFRSSDKRLDGIVAPLWDDWHYSIRTQFTAVLASFTIGTAPNRTWILSWEDVGHRGRGNRCWFQLHLHEASGRITFAYKDDLVPSTFTQIGYQHGIEEPDRGERVNSRFVSPFPESGTLDFHPGTDYQFDPTVTRFTGRLLADFPVADETGIGGSIDLSRPVVGVEVQLVDVDGDVVRRAITDENGEYELRGLALPTQETGSVRVVSKSPACTVGRVAGEVEAFELHASVSFEDDLELGTSTITATNDVAAEFRAPLFIASRLQSLADRYGDFSETVVAPVAVVFDPDSVAETAYTPREVDDPAVIRVGSAAGGNSDAWDGAVLTRVWARAFLDALTGAPGPSHEPGLEVVSNPENAFAEGFGAFLHAHVTGDPTLVDATGSQDADTFDVEARPPVNLRGDDVAAAVAAVLWDLHDGTDPAERRDGFDGTDNPDRVFEAIDAIVGEATTDNFAAAWDSQGFDRRRRVQIYIFDGVLTDDASEDNDTPETAADLGVVGAEIDNRILNLHNDDWYLVHLPEPSEGIQAILTYGRENVAREIVFEIRSAATEELLATGTAANDSDPLVAQTGPVNAGDYLVGIEYVDGVVIRDYSLKTFERLTQGAYELPDWTVGQPFSVDVPIANGVPPYVTTQLSDAGLPAGLQWAPGENRVRGVPFSPGTYSFSLTLRDSAFPQNEVTAAHLVVINPEFVLESAPVLGLPIGRAAEIALEPSGGTAPFAVELDDGTLPTGVELLPTAPELRGTIGGSGSWPLRIDAIDAAGATQSIETTLVACADAKVKKSPVALAAGPGATGFWRDAVAGSQMTLSVKTSKKRAKRQLEAVVVDSSGNVIESGKVRGGKGKASFKGVIAPRTGRYFFIVTSEEGDESQLEGSSKIKPPKKASGIVDEFDPSHLEEVEIGALAGARLKFQAKPNRGSGVELGVQVLVSPSGRTFFGPALDVRSKKGSIQFDRELDESGTWRVRLVHTGGGTGGVKYKVKLKQPKGGVYSLDD